MKYLFIQLNFVLLFCLIISCNYSQNKNSKDSSFINNDIIPNASICVKLRPHTSIIFNNAFYDKNIVLSNSSNKDSLVIYRISMNSTNEPIHLYYISDVMRINLPDIQRMGNIILLPGDSISLNENFDIIYSSGFPTFIDSIITIPQDAVLGIFINSLNGKQLRDANTSTIISEINKLYQNNEEKIKISNFNTERKTVLENFNLIIRDKLFTNIANNHTSAKDKLIFDSLYYNYISKDIPQITSVNSDISDDILYLTVIYKGKKNGIGSNNFWDCFLNLDTSLQNSLIYKRIAFRNVKENFINQFDSLKSIYLKLQHASRRSPVIDSFTKFTRILLETYTNYDKAKQDLQSFDGGKYVYLFEEENKSNHEPKNITMTSDETLYDFNNMKTTFKTELFRDTAKYKYVFIDFWASWCVPCVSDYPDLKKFEDKYKNEPIKFISISTDTKSNTQKWIDRTKQLGNYNKPNNFIIDSSFDSHIAKFFDITSIPKYIIIDKNGNIIDEDFAHPLDNDFELRLKQLLNK